MPPSFYNIMPNASRVDEKKLSPLKAC